MEKVLIATGIIWAIIGFFNLITILWDGPLEEIVAARVIFNMLVFILPGMMVYGIGAVIKKRRAASKASVE